MDTNKSYSQVGQDLWALDYAKKLGLHPGFFLDVGAYNGVYYSNSLLLEESGWSGLCVEPNPELAEAARKIRKCQVVEAAINDLSGKALFKPDDLSGMISEHGSLEVNCFTFYELFKTYNVPNEITYMSLDVEGNEGILLRTFPFDTYRCRLITVEHNLYLGDDTNKNLIYQILTENGYLRIVNDVEHVGLKFEDWYILL